MRKLLALAALVLGLAACQTEPEGLDVNVGGEVDTVVSVSLPEATRANSAEGALENDVLNGENTLRYILQVYQKVMVNNEETWVASKETKFEYSDEQSVVFPVRLVPGRDYKFVVWADIVKGKNAGDNYYITGALNSNNEFITDLTNITINADKWNAMDEARDAYTSVVRVNDYNSSSSINITLTRPFAKLRVLTTDMQALANLQIAPAKGKVIYNTEHYAKFNALTETAFNKTIATKTHKYAIENYEEGVLFVDYFFANNDVVKFYMDIMEAGGARIKENNFSTDIAVQRNYLTTIQGNILTDGNNVTVTVKENGAFANDDNPTDEPYYQQTISSAAELLAAVENGGEYIVISDIDVTPIASTLAATRATDVTTINLNGYTITLKTNIEVESGKTLTINDINENGENGAIINAGGKLVNEGTLNIEGGEFGADTIENNNGVVNITGGTFESNPSDFVDDDYTVVNNNGEFTLVQKEEAVEINGTKYRSIKKAVAAAQNGETVTFILDVEQADGVVITDKNITIDLNNKTFTVSEGANTNNRNFKVNGSSVVTIKNGTMVAQGDITSGAYGTLRTEDNANVTLENVKLYSYRGYGLNVKACTGTTININNSEIYSQYSGGVEAAGGNIEMTNVKIEQKGVYSSGAWCSVAIGVNGNGNVTINSGDYSASTIASDSNAAQGTWVAYVMSSGGTLNIKGGTFNGVVAETASAANACGLICADRAAVVEIHGGTFKSNGAILDMRNNVGTMPNPKATLYGGTFSADPRVSGLYSSNLITVAEGCEVTEANGVWTVRVLPVAKIGETEYETLEAAVAAAQAGNTITVLRDITLAEQLGLPADIIFNGNGKQINGSIYAGGDLTFVGHTKVTAFSASYYDRVITIGEGACLEVTGTGRVTLGYGNTFNITGSIEDAKTADKATIQPSLIIPGGISITGGNDATMNVTNAYVKIGSTSSKNSAANGTFTLNFNNAVAEFTNQLTFAEPTNGMNPTFNLNIVNSVLTTGTKLILAAPNCEMNVDNSTINISTYFGNSGIVTLTNGSELTGSSIQDNEGINHRGSTTVNNSTFTINATSTGHAFNGRNEGSITAQNKSHVTVTYYKGITITTDATSTFTGVDVDANKKIYYTGEKKVDPTNAEAFGGAVIVSNEFKDGKGVITFDRDITTIGNDAFKYTGINNWMTSITLPESVTSIGDWAFYMNMSLMKVNIPGNVVSIGERAFGSCYDLVEINCEPTTPPTLSPYAFANVSATCYVPATSVDAYKVAWSDYEGNIEGR